MAAKLTSNYGKRVHPIHKVKKHHHGIDLAAPLGTPIRSIAEGKVVFADFYKGYGNLVVIMHSDGHTSHYGHCESIKVSPGNSIKSGQIIATVGKTGAVTGSHLHLEIRKNGKSINPNTFLTGLNETAQG
ncbi:UNVERIFIED_CONTAM: hypothetical protein GTU68_052906 [Idotea baltica]|nr:hypothetical protein [Idotea baltica]